MFCHRKSERSQCGCRMNKQFFANLLTGTLLFSRFKLVRCLSAGETGGVYLVEDMFRHKRRMAIKVSAAHARYDDSVSAQLFRELRLSRCISHPNVLRGEEFFRDDDFVAFTMEYMEGGSLADRLERRDPFRIGSCLRILTELCDGLQAIHDAGIIHRDLKPENVLLSNDSSVRIADFGISAPAAGSGSPNESITGSLNYLAPEYVAHGHYDIRSDIYAIGVIAYELATGKLPFSGRTLLETLTQRVRFDPVPPHSAVTHVPRPLSHAIMRAMDRNPDNRFRCLTELRDAVNFIRLPNGIPLWAVEQP